MRVMAFSRKSWWIVPLSAMLAVVGVSQSRAVTPDNFRINNTGDLVALCSADSSAPEYTAAIHFCHGFASGAFQYYQMVAAAVPEARFVCAPDPPPSRSDAITGFVEWVR